MTFRQLQVFRLVCDQRSYSRAAEEMSLTQPAVSLQIRQLEELLGQPLFDYVGKKLYLTDAAEALQRATATMGLLRNGRNSRSWSVGTCDMISRSSRLALSRLSAWV